MERRSFLQSAGAAVAAGAAVFSREDTPAAQPTADRPTVLVSSAESPLGESIASAVAVAYKVRRLDSAATSGDTASEAKTLLEEQLSGCDAVVCVAHPPDATDAGQTIDYRTRCVYQLLAAAVRQNVRLVIYLGSLEVVSGYSERLEVDEAFRPIPTTDAASLSPYLGEFVCREFAREGKIRCVCLRLGRIRASVADPAVGSDPLAVEMGDVIQAVEQTLAVGLSPSSRLAAWEVFHIQSAFSGARFSTAKARRVLGYKPRT